MATTPTVEEKKSIWDKGDDPNNNFEHATQFDVLTSPEVTEELREKFKKGLVDLQNGTIPVKEGKQYPSTNFDGGDGFLYGVNWNPKTKGATFWRTVKKAGGGSTGDKKLYRLSQVESGTTAHINKFLSEHPSEFWQFAQAVAVEGGEPIIFLTRRQVWQPTN